MKKIYKWADPQNMSILLTTESTQVWFPAEDDNRDYQIFLEWVADGNTPEPYAEITEIDTITDIITAKNVSSNSVRRNAHSVLQPTDWVVVRAAETGVEAPADITSFRESVRTASASKIATIESKTDLESLKAYLRSDEYKNWPEQ